MSGFAGIVYSDSLRGEEQINPMLQSLRNSAPLKLETHTQNQVQIGTVGLPIAYNKEKNLAAILEGTFYNFEELKDELINDGFHFTSGNPSEILIYAYQLWGEKLLEKVEGDFALALMDYEKQKLLLARDRIGKKTLYWFHDGKTLVFGTRLKSLLATDLIPKAPALEPISSYFYFGYFPQDLTAVKDINKLLPSHYLLFYFNNSKLIEPYWSYSSYFQKTLVKPKKTILSTLDHLLLSATEKRIPKGAGSVGCFISGGLGSAASAYYADKAIKPKQLKAFTVGFQGENDSDVRSASEVAESLMIPHHIEWVTKKSFLKDITKIIWHLDEPIADANILATYRLAELASKEVSYVFSGMGSDELLAGHTRYTLSHKDVSLADRLINLPKSMIKFILPFLNLVNKRLSYKFLKKTRRDPWQYEYLNQNALFNEKIMKEAMPKLASLFDPDVFLHKFYHLNRIHSTVSSFLYFDVKTRLADSYIFQYEHLTHAFGLSWQTPFLDRSIVEFLASLKEPELLTESETAALLKNLMKGVYKESFINRPKKSRPLFLSSWAANGEFMELLPYLKNGTLVEAEIISEKWLNKVMLSKESVAQNFGYLFAILVLEIWFRLFLNKQVEYEPSGTNVKLLLSQI